jgi:DMSO/TMAO reductase YedYZ molybdopterin-dependent catalytic subunit
MSPPIRRLGGDELRGVNRLRRVLAWFVSPTAIAGYAGIVVAVLALSVAEALTALRRSWRSPVLDVGDRMIDILAKYPRLKQTAIDLFGTKDKLALLIGIGVMLTVYAFVMGVVAIRKSLLAGTLMVGLFAIVGTWAALGRANSTLGAIVPTLVGAAVGAASLRFISRRLAAPTPTDEPAEAWAPTDEAAVATTPSRRRFLGDAGRLLGAVGAAAAVLGLGGRAIARTRFSAASSRKNVSVPTAEQPLAPVPAGVEVDVPGSVPFITPNSDFYRIDTALEVPQLSTSGYTLTVKGLVDNEIVLTWQDLLNRPMIERDVTLTCVSNNVGGHYIGTARWIGARLDELLREAGPRDGADMIVGRSVDGYECGFPLENALDGRDAIIAVAMNGEPLPLEHGFPARLVVPGLYGYVSATKWLTEIELTRFADFEHYWEKRGWAERAPIKLQSRIDVPKGLAKVSAGTVPVAGVAWAQRVGVAAVEVSIDDGEWQSAELAAEDTIDTWRQWVYQWDATPGRHSIKVRATGQDGTVQTSRRAEPIPDGATGHHQIVVIVE